MPKYALNEVPDNVISAKFEIITPLFLGDANQKATSIRPTSIKGALRFWWRAINAHLSLADLAKEEARIFGSTLKQGLFSLFVTHCDNLGVADTSWPISDSNCASSYLGYGLVGDGQNPHREAIKAGIKFTVELQFSPTASEEDKKKIQKAVEAFGIFGSLGSRARRGFGSVQLVNVNETPFMQLTPSTIQAWLKASLNSNLKSASTLEFSGFSKDSQFAMPHAKANRSFSDYRVCHKDLGKIYKTVRSLIKPTQARAVFGLPRKNVNEKLRRASPLFIKVIKNSPQTYQGLFLYLPSQFHPDYTQADFNRIKPLLNEINAEKCI